MSSFRLTYREEPGIIYNENSVKGRKKCFHIHHIVPKAMKEYELARAVLYDAGIDCITDPDNHVILSNRFHWYIHNEFYMIAINGIFAVVSAVNKDKDQAQKEYNARLVLRTIGSLLTVADQAARAKYM